MSYFTSKKVSGQFDAVVARVKEILQKEGFGVISEIDIAGKLKEKLGVGFKAYRILGACNPLNAHKALLAEDKIGVMLPCNVVVIDQGGGTIEVAAINPQTAMAAVNNPALADIAVTIGGKLRNVIESL